MLIFAPNNSIIKRLFNGNLAAWGQLPQVKENWSAEIQTLEGHSNWVSSVAFSPDSQLLASSSSDSTVKLWDPTTGDLQKTLEGHSNRVWSLAFSPDSKLLASDSGDNTIKLWDPTTGELKRTLHGHSKPVWSLTFSPDSKLLASGSNDNTVKLWNPTTGELQKTLEGHSHWNWTETNVGISILQDQWVCLQGKKLLWLPPEYRPTCSAMKDSILALGHVSGWVSFLMFGVDASKTK